jgi:hypothetical protein
MPGSKMAEEMLAYGNEKPFHNAVTIADLAFQYTHDHLTLLSQALAVGTDPFTCCTLIRSILEPAAVAAWVVDPRINIHKRVARIYSIRYESIVENVKVLRCSNGIALDAIEKTKAKIDDLANDAIANGLSVGRNKRGEIIWVGMAKPGATSMIADVLNDEWLYRLLSAVAHGQNWALRHIGYSEVLEDPTDGSSLLKKREFPEAVLLVSLHGMLALSRLIWNTIGYRETDRLPFEELLENTMDRLGLTISLRFWRNE